MLANRDNISVLQNFVCGDTPERSDVRALVTQIRNNHSSSWEARLYSLSPELNIRLLPLKTLLVHLEMGGIMQSRYSYFEELPFKYLSDKDAIISRFEGERQEFVRAILEHSYTAKIWTKPDIEAIVAASASDRRRILTALAYLDEKGWIELQTRRTVEVYEILSRDFDVEEQTDKLFNTMKEREEHELRRISQMVGFFESRTCLSKRLSEYFGEKTGKDCGHCSVCAGKIAELKVTLELPPLSGFDFEETTSSLLQAVDGDPSDTLITRFLCGIRVQGSYELSRVPEFGFLDRYPYADVAKWVGRQRRTGPDPIDQSDSPAPIS